MGGRCVVSGRECVPIGALEVNARIYLGIYTNADAKLATISIIMRSKPGPERS